MAQKVTVSLVDDLDGSEAEESVEFGLDGATYQIDLSSKNATKILVLDDASIGREADCLSRDGHDLGVGQCPGEPALSREGQDA